MTWPLRKDDCTGEEESPPNTSPVKVTDEKRTESRETDGWVPTRGPLRLIQPRECNRETSRDPRREDSPDLETEVIRKFEYPSYPSELIEEIISILGSEEDLHKEGDLHPSRLILDQAMHLVQRVVEQSLKDGRQPLFPDIAPGPRGEIELDYVRGGKRLSIDIWPIAEGYRMVILKVKEDLDGKVVGRERFGDSDLDEVIGWFLTND